MISNFWYIFTLILFFLSGCYRWLIVRKIISYSTLYNRNESQRRCHARKTQKNCIIERSIKFVAYTWWNRATRLLCKKCFLLVSLIIETKNRNGVLKLLFCCFFSLKILNGKNISYYGSNSANSHLFDSTVTCFSNMFSLLNYSVFIMGWCCGVGFQFVWWTQFQCNIQLLRENGDLSKWKYKCFTLYIGGNQRYSKF